MMLPNDHIDLLVTALADWQLLALGSQSADQQVLDAVGLSIQLANIASEKALARVGHLSGRDTVALASHRPGYAWTRVTDPFEAIDVLKATHAAIHECSHAPQWTTTRAAGLLIALATAAAQRLPGYETAPWIWQRAGSITCAVGHAGADPAMAIRGLIWCDSATLDEQWDSAVLIVLTPSALDALDPSLPARRNVVVLTFGEGLTEAQWDQIASLGDAPLVVDLKVGQGWLEDLIEKMNRHAAQPQAS